MSHPRSFSSGGMAIDVGGDGSIVQVCNVLHHFLLRAFPENYESRAVETRGDLVGVGLHLTHTLSGFDIVLVFSMFQLQE